MNALAQSVFRDPLTTPFFGNAIKTVPTFNSCSYYFRPDGQAALRVEYKRTNEADWHPAHPAVCDQPEGIHKGSLFNLDEDTEYQIRVVADRPPSDHEQFERGEITHEELQLRLSAPPRVPANFNPVIMQTTFRTWTSTPQIAKTIDLSTLPGTAQNGLVIAEQGTPDGWIKYTAPDGWIVRQMPRDTGNWAFLQTLRAPDQQEAAIVLRGAQYIILENLTIEGGRLNGILVDNCDFVRILNCDISGWGRTGEQRFDTAEQAGWYRDSDGRWINYDGAIQIRRSAATVVERCYIHDPRGRANSWVFSHPTGPQAVVVDHTRGGNVIRWNDFIGSDEHRWNDVIECLSNDSPTGGFYRDSDIIGNYLAFGNDDGVELEGGGINLRFVGNKVEGVLCGVSLGANMVGPQYVIGNLVVNLGDEEGLALNYIKNSHGTEQKGKRFVYNNTFHGVGRSAGSAYGGYGRATPIDAGLGTMRNNIFVGNSSSRPGDWARAEHFDNDLFWVNESLSDSEIFIANFRRYEQEMNGYAANPQLADPAAGNYRLSPDSIAHGKSAEVPGITRTGDPLGAFINGVTDIPRRPLTLAAVPAQVNFPETGGDTVVTLTLPADAAEPVAFQIRQNSVFDWFTVTPASGTVVPGDTLNLTVTVDPAKLTGRPMFRGAFLVRTPTGLSRPVSVYAKGVYTAEKRPASAGPNTVYIAAESGKVDTQVNIPQDSVYSLLIRISPTTPRGGGGPVFEITLDGRVAVAVGQSGYWYLRSDTEQMIWLHSFGTLKAGAKHLQIQPAQNLTDVEYIVTDNPAVFFLQERHRKE